MHRAKSQNCGVRVRLRLTNRMRASLSLASNMRRILLHGKDKNKFYTQPVMCNFVAKCMNESANAHGTGPDDDSMTSHLLECVKQKYPAGKAQGILN